MAVYLARNPRWVNCEACNCVDGRAPFPRWAVGDEDEPIFPDGADAAGNPQWSRTTNVCPRRIVDASAYEWLDAFHHYQNGFLWCAGGVRDQPKKYLDTMALIAAIASRVDTDG